MHVDIIIQILLIYLPTYLGIVQSDGHYNKNFKNVSTLLQWFTNSSISISWFILNSSIYYVKMFFLTFNCSSTERLIHFMSSDDPFFSPGITHIINRFHNPLFPHSFVVDVHWEMHPRRFRPDTYRPEPTGPSPKPVQSTSPVRLSFSLPTAEL